MSSPDPRMKNTLTALIIIALRVRSKGQFFVEFWSRLDLVIVAAAEENGYEPLCPSVRRALWKAVDEALCELLPWHSLVDATDLFDPVLRRRGGAADKARLRAEFGELMAEEGIRGLVTDYLLPQVHERYEKFVAAQATATK